MLLQQGNSTSPRWVVNSSKHTRHLSESLQNRSDILPVNEVRLLAEAIFLSVRLLLQSS